MNRWWTALYAGIAALALVATATSSVQAQEKIAPAAMQALKDKGKIRVIISTKPEPGQLGGGRSLSRPVSYVSRLLGPSVSNVRRIGSLAAVSAVITTDALEKLQDDPNIGSVVIDELRRPYLMDSVPLVGAAQLHEKGLTGKGVTVAILDSGIDRKHPAFKGAIKQEACFSTNDDPRTEVQSLCPDQATEAEGKGVSGKCPRKVEGCYHGTHVAGIVAGRRQTLDDGTIIEGMAPAASLIAIQIFTLVKDKEMCAPYRADSCILSYDSDSLRGLSWIYDNYEKYNIVAINMSFGGGDFKEHCDTQNPDYTDMIQRLRVKGIASVIASGNDAIQDGMGSPACITGAISVGAITKQGNLDTSYSNTAKWLTIAAPGTNIVSTMPGNKYASLGGTSMASPHVAGAVALLKSMDPTMKVKDIVKLLRSKGNKITDPRTNTKLRSLNMKDIEPQSDLVAAVKALPDDEDATQ